MDKLAFEIDKLEFKILSLIDEIERTDDSMSSAGIRLKLSLEKSRADLFRLRDELDCELEKSG